MPRGRGRNRPRLVRATPLSAPAETLRQSILAHLEPEQSGHTRVAGFFLVTLFETGSTSKSIYTPEVGKGAPVGRDLFHAMCHVAIDNMVADRIADNRAVDRVNAAQGWEPVPDPA